MVDYKKINEQYYCFTKLIDHQPTKGSLQGLTFSFKDSLWYTGEECRACSQILKGFIAPQDATIITRIKEHGGLFVGSTVMDEFGFGSHTTNLPEDIPAPVNPLDKNLSCGGSSGGAAVAAKVLGDDHVAIGESTGGSIESPASSCGVIGYCPTYGLISRFGLVSYADSFDKIGFLSTKTKNIEQVLRASIGFDPKDQTSLQEEPDWSIPEKFSVVYPKEALQDVSLEVKQSFESFLKTLEEQGVVVREVTMPITFSQGLATYYVLASAEASTNLARFCGLRYGLGSDVENKHFDEYFTSIRDSFTKETKRRVLLGTFTRMQGYRDKYYERAAKIRTLIKKEFEVLEEEIIIFPTLPSLPPTKESVKKQSVAQTYAFDRLVVGPNLAGVPHASIPVSKLKGSSFGVTVCSGWLKEGALLGFLSFVEEIR